MAGRRRRSGASIRETPDDAAPPPTAGAMRLVSETELAYVRANSVRENDIQRRLRTETERLAEVSWASAPEVSQFLALMVEALGARRVLEVGVFTGLSTLAMAYALPPGGRIVACDIAEAKGFTDLARRYWQEAEVTAKIDFRIAPAVETLDALIADGAGGGFDLCYIDADKKAYDDYYERALVLLRPGGLIVFDNTLWSGSVLDPASADGSTRALRALNRKLHEDERVSLSMLPIDDGVTLACKRAG